MEYKKAVAKNFSLKAKAYDELSVIQSKVGVTLLSMLKKIPSGLILDVGSGSGRIAKRLGAIGIDVSFSMCRLCSEKGVKIVCGDGEVLPFLSGSFELVISNFSYQWMDIAKAFKEANRVLRKGGYFLFSIPIRGSLKELFDSWNETFEKHFELPDRLFSFREREEVLSNLEGFTVLESKEFEEVVFFNSARDAVKVVTGIGARNPFRKIFVSKSFYKDFVENYKKQGNGKFPIRYRVLIVLARK